MCSPVEGFASKTRNQNSGTWEEGVWYSIKGLIYVFIYLYFMRSFDFSLMQATPYSSRQALHSFPP